MTATADATARVPSGLFDMVQAAWWFAVMSLLVKLAGQTLPTAEIVFGRGCVTLLLSATLLWRASINPLRSFGGLLLLRGLFGSTALMCFYGAINHLPLAEATVIQQTSPLFTALLAAWLLRERLESQVLLAIAICLAGVVLIAQPPLLFGGEHGPLDWRFVGIGLLGAVLAAFAYVTVRQLRSSHHPLVVVFYFPVVTVAMSAPFAIADWVWPSATGWLLLASIGIVTQFGQLALTRGLSRAPAGRATTVSYLQIAVATLLGALVFQTWPNGWSAVGITLIVVSLLATARGFRRQPA